MSQKEEAQKKLRAVFAEYVGLHAPSARGEEVDRVALGLTERWMAAEAALLADLEREHGCTLMDRRNNGLVTIRPELRWQNILTERCVHGNPKAGIVVKDWWARWGPSTYVETVTDLGFLPHHWMDNLVRNYKRIAEQETEARVSKQPARSLKDLYATWRGGSGPHEGRPAYIVGSGPSLEQNVAELGRVTNGMVIAVNGALKSVEKPDYFLTLDWKGADWWWRGQEEKIRKTTALLMWGAAPDLFNLEWDDLRPYAHMGNIPADGWVRERFPWMDDLDRGYTSTYAAFHFAVLAGANPIVFVGCDCAIGAEKIAHGFHRDKPDESQVELVARDIHGKETVTTGMHMVHAQHLIGAARWCRHYGVKVINATENGILWDDMMPDAIQQAALGDTVTSLNAMAGDNTAQAAPMSLDDAVVTEALRQLEVCLVEKGLDEEAIGRAIQAGTERWASTRRRKEANAKAYVLAQGSGIPQPCA